MPKAKWPFFWYRLFQNLDTTHTTKEAFDAWKINDQEKDRFNKNKAEEHQYNKDHRETFWGKEIHRG